MNEPLPTETRIVFDALRARSGAVGLDSWLCDTADGTILDAPGDGEPDPRTEVVVTAAGGWKTDSPNEPVLIDGDQWLFGVPLPTPGRPRPLVAFFAMTERAPRQADMRSLGLTFQGLLAETARDAARMHDFLLASCDLSRELSESYERMSVVYQIGRSMTYIATPVDFVRATCVQLLELLDFGWIAVQYFDRAAALGITETKPLTFGTFEADPAAFKAVLKTLVRADGSRPLCSILDVGDHPLTDLMRCQVMLNPIMHDELVVGMLCAGGKPGVGSEADVTSHETQLLDVVAELISVFQVNAFRFAVQQSMFNGTIGALSSAIDAKDPYTRGHSERVAYIGKQIGLQLGLSEDDIEHIHIAGLVHDVGKIGIPESVLCKAGALTDEEWAMMKRHPSIGYEILKDIHQLEPMLPGVLHHHECFAGNGYPTGLKGDDIPIIARILAVADAFDAMSSDRAYRAHRPRDVVLKIMRENDRGQWDQAVVDAFLDGVDLTVYDGMVAKQARVGDRFAA